jgi:hypothetical protein
MQTRIRVTWGYRTPIGALGDEEVRTLVREFASAKKAAEFACDIIFMLEGPAHANAHTDKFYLVNKGRPRVCFENNLRTDWVEVLLVERDGGVGERVKPTP